MVESSNHCHRSHAQCRLDGPGRHVVGFGRAGRGRVVGADNRMGRLLRVDVGGAAVAVVFALVATGIGLVYYFGPDVDQDWVWITPGAVAATILWLLVSLLFKLYVANFTDYEASYGTVGGVIVVLLWFYVSSIAILAGAELNAEIEHASPYGKAPGLKNAKASC